MRSLRERMKSRREHLLKRRVKPIEIVLPDPPAPESSQTTESKARMKRFDKRLAWVLKQKPNGFTCVLPLDAMGYEPPADETSPNDQAPEISPKPGLHNQ